jgi:hypothetical protein
LNRYTYTHNNPVGYIDPSGYDPIYARGGDGVVRQVDTSQPIYAIGGDGQVRQIDISQPVYAIGGDGEVTQVNFEKSSSSVNDSEKINELAKLDISYGRKSNDTGYFQSQLAALGYYSGISSRPVDNEFGMLTLAAFLRFQLQNGWLWDDLFNNDGLYKGVDLLTLLTLNGSIEELIQNGFSYSGSDSYNPANETFVRNGLIYRVGSSAFSPINPEMDTNLLIQTIVWDSLISRGFSKAQVAGIMGNAMQESGWNPLRRGSNNQYWGLFQLNATMSRELQSLYRDAGLDMDTYGYDAKIYQGAGAQYNIPKNDLMKILEIQLEYIYNSKPTGSEWISRLRSASSVEEAAEVFLVQFEGATTSIRTSANEILYYYAYKGSYYQEARLRREYARTYYGIFAP